MAGNLEQAWRQLPSDFEGQTAFSREKQVYTMASENRAVFLQRALGQAAVAGEGC